MKQGRFQMLLRAVYPPRCLSCGSAVESDFGLCAMCWAATPFIGGTICNGCGAPLIGPDDGHRNECDDCLAAPRPWAQARAALLYSGGGRDLVLRLKHGDRQDISRPAAAWMARAGAEILTQDTLLVPVPLHWSRMMARRYNQSALLGHALSRLTGLRHIPDLLVRTRRTPSLGRLGHDARAEILNGAIAPHPKRRALARGRQVVLIDDVMTSGATLCAATGALHAAGAAQVGVLLLARAVKAP